MPRDERLLVERWLGRVLADDETVSVSVYGPHPPPNGAELAGLRREIVSQAREIGSRAQGVTDDEVEAIVNEAFAETRGKSV
jgi:hypothetical protein